MSKSDAIREETLLYVSAVDFVRGVGRVIITELADNVCQWGNAYRFILRMERENIISAPDDDGVRVVL